MKKTGMYVKGINEIPEVRSVAPGHLVRCGHSSAYDVNFGKEVGAGAFILLNQGISGVTVAGISNGKSATWKPRKPSSNVLWILIKWRSMKLKGFALAAPVVPSIPRLKRSQGHLNGIFNLIASKEKCCHSFL